MTQHRCQRRWVVPIFMAAGFGLLGCGDEVAREADQVMSEILSHWEKLESILARVVIEEDARLAEPELKQWNADMRAIRSRWNAIKGNVESDRLADLRKDLKDRYRSRFQDLGDSILWRCEEIKNNQSLSRHIGAEVEEATASIIYMFS